MFRTVNYWSNFTRNYRIYPLISNAEYFPRKMFSSWNWILEISRSVAIQENNFIVYYSFTRNLSFNNMKYDFLRGRRIQSEPSIVNTLKMIVSARASQIIVPNFSRNIAFIRMNPGKRKFGRKSSIPLLKFQIFTTIKREFLGRGRVIAPFFGHNAVINRPLSPPFPSPTIIFDRVQIAHCTPSIRFDRLFKMETFPFPTGTRHDENLFSSWNSPSNWFGTSLPLGLSARYVRNIRRSL